MWSRSASSIQAAEKRDGKFHIAATTTLTWGVSLGDDKDL